MLTCCSDTRYGMFPIAGKEEQLNLVRYYDAFVHVLENSVHFRIRAFGNIGSPA